MLLIQSREKRGFFTLLLILVLFLASCSNKKCPWIVATDCSASDYYRSVKVFNTVCNTFRDIRLEIVSIGCDWEAFLVVQSVPVIEPGAMPMIPVSMWIDDYQTIFSVSVYEGGQKALLPKEIAEIIIDALQQQQEVVIEMGRYKSRIPWEGFPCP